MDNQTLDKYNTAPIPLRAYIKQQGQQDMQSLPSNLQQPIDINQIQPLTQAPDPIRATNNAVGAGADPRLLALAKSTMSPDAYVGYCEKFVENAQGKNGVYPSAIAAWQAQQDRATPGLNGIQPGDQVYFGADASNGGNGHVGIYTGGNGFISATNNGIQNNDLNAWQKQTGQKVLGYIRGGTK